MSEENLNIKSMNFMKKEEKFEKEENVSELKEELKDKIIANIVEIPTVEICFSKEHKYPLYKDEKLEEFKENIKENGIITALHIRKIIDPQEPQYKYEVIIGNNRLKVALILGMQYLPCIIENVSSERAKAMHHSSNLYQRSFDDLDYVDRIAVINQCYSKTYINNELSEEEIEKMSQVVKKMSLSESSIKKYIKMNTLLDDITIKIDENKIAFNAAYFLSFLSEENQFIVLDLINSGNKIDVKIAKVLKEKAFSLNEELIKNIVKGTKKEKKSKKFFIENSIIEKYFVDTPKKEIPNLIKKALDQYFEKGES